MLDVAVLGPIEVRVEGTRLDLGPAKQRQLFAALVLASGRPVPSDELVERLWRGQPPASASHAVQVYVSGLRKLLRDAGRPPSLVTADSAYCLTQVRTDASAFEQLLADGDASEALTLWRGEPYLELADDPLARREASRLGQLRLTALEARMVAGLEAGDHHGCIAELERLTGEHPFHERFWELSMLALYRAGRQADALRRFQDLRAVLVEELGIEPGPAAQDLEARILGQDPSLVLPARGSPRRPMSPQVKAAAARDRPLDEQRVVTALFCDLVGSTKLGEQLDPGDFKLIVDGAVAAVKAAVDRYGGTVLGVAGDGTCAVFGAPEAHEDDPERAVRAGLEIADALAHYGADVAAGWGVDPLAVRVGVHTGPVALGPIGAGAIADLTALGDTMNLASRIESNASPNTVSVGDVTRGRCDALFEWADERTITVKGRTDAVTVSRVVRALPGGRRRRATEGLRAPLTGRNREFAHAAAAVDGVLAGGRGGVVAITGQAGHGKSRMLAEVRARFERAAPEGAVWLEGVATSFGQSDPYTAVRGALADWLGLAGLPPVRARVALQRRAQAVLGEAGPHLLGLAALLGVGGDARPQADEVPAAVEALLGALAEQAPVVLALDDLHWADPSTLETAERLLDLCERSALLLILVSRPERDHPSWDLRERARRDLGQRYSEVDLVRLDDEDVGRLADALVGAGTLPPDVRAELVAAADGVPFYLEELVRGLIATGALATGPSGEWRFERAAVLSLPATVEQVIVSRFSRLSPAGRDVASAAALLGRTFSANELAAVVPEFAAAPDDLERVLIELERADLLVEARRWPQRAHRFGHALAQAAVATTLTPDRRRAIHRRAVEHLEALDDPVEVAAELARHCELAGEPAKAFDYRRLAAAAAEAMHAPTEELDHLRAAERLSLGGAEIDAARLAELHCALGRTSVLLGRPVDAGRALERAIVLAQSIGDLTIEQAATEQLGIRDMLQDFASSEARFARVAELARERSDVHGEVFALSRTAILAANRSDLDRAASLTSRALALADAHHDRPLRMIALDAQKLHLAYTGDFVEQQVVLDELEAYQRASDDRFYLPYTVQERAFAPFAAGRIDEALAVCEQALALAAEFEHSMAGTLARVLRCRVLTTAGRLGEALAEATELSDDAVAVTFGSWVSHLVASVELSIGRKDAAAASYAKVFADATTSGIGSYRLLAAAKLAELTDGPTSDGWLEQASSTFRSMRLPPGRAFLFVWEAYTAIAGVLLRRGDAAGAQSVVAPMVTAAHGVWHEAVAAGSLVLAACVPPERRAPLVDRAVLAAEASGAPATLWRAQATAAAIEADPMRKAEHLVAAHRTIDRLAATLTNDGDRTTLAEASARELEVIVRRWPDS